MLESGEIVSTPGTTRERRVIETVHRPVVRGNRRPIEAAAARKRLLHTRYLTWASGSQGSGAGVIGPALEDVVNRSLREASRYGYRQFSDATSGEIRTLFGEPVPGGPIDNGALLTLLDDAQTFIGMFTVLVEAKNLREWIYPRSQELHQLLDKAARLQIAHPKQRIVPVLICRRMHPQDTPAMARQLGFYVIQTQRQYVPQLLADGVEARRMLDEVNGELGYDLVPGGSAVAPMVGHFRSQLQAAAVRTSERWAESVPALADTFARLREPRLSKSERAAWMQEQAELSEQAHGEQVRWYARPGEEPDFDQPDPNSADQRE